MHKRASFKPADPAWDDIEGGLMRTLAAGGTAGQAAWKALFDIYGTLFVKRLIGLGLPPEAAAETAQELWIEVAQAARRWDGERPVRVFLLSILFDARHRHFKAGRALPRLDSLSDEVVSAQAEALLPIFAEEDRSPEVWYAFVHCVRAAFGHFAQASPRLAQLLYHRHVDELSLDECAELLGGDAKLAKSQVFSAREKLRPDLQRCLALWPNRKGKADTP